MAGNQPSSSMNLAARFCAYISMKVENKEVGFILVVNNGYFSTDRILLSNMLSVLSVDEVKLFRP